VLVIVASYLNMVCSTGEGSKYLYQAQLHLDIVPFRYVVSALWAPSGNFFVTGSYDHSFCVYR
jgi:hypothetical protein